MDQELPDIVGVEVEQDGEKPSAEVRIEFETTIPVILVIRWDEESESVVMTAESRGTRFAPVSLGGSPEGVEYTALDFIGRYLGQYRAEPDMLEKTYPELYVILM